MNEQLLQRTPSGENKKNRVPRYVFLWEKIRALEVKLNHQEAINEVVLRQFASIIRPLEETVTHELCELTIDLIGYFHNEDSDAHRSLFGFWIIDNFSTLASHPFANPNQVEELFDQWRLPLQGTEDMVEAQLSLLMAGRGDLPGQDNRRSNYPDADLFADPLSAGAPMSAGARRSASTSSSDKDDDNAGDTQDDSGDHREPHRHTNEHRTPPSGKDNQGNESERDALNKKAKETTQGKKARNDNDEDLGDLFNIDILFRRIARAVHPDREQDEQKKAEKHAIMSTSLEARANEDIAQLLTLYALHVGNLPDNWSNESTGDLVIALEEQLHELENRSIKLQSQDPLLQLIQNRYLSFDMQEVTAKINRHKEELDIEIRLLKTRRDELITEQGLLDALEERRDIEMDRLVVADLTS